MMSESQKLLQQALYWFGQDEPFYACLLQELTFKVDHYVPTAAISFDKKQDSYTIHVNPDFFKGLSHEERLAILYHEVLHFTHQHLLRFQTAGVPKEKMMLANVAADMSINQLINKNDTQGGKAIYKLPEGTVDYRNWKTNDGKSFPPKLSFEQYYELIDENQDANKDKFEPGKGEGQESTLDEHLWDEISDEDKQKMLQEMKAVLKRTIEKSSYGYSKVPDNVKDLLQELDGQINQLDYKRILKETIRKSIAVSDRASTWNRPNKRYGVFARGSTVGKVPLVSFFLDSSGSISYTEMCEFMSIVSGFLKVGSKKCNINFWHTALYATIPYRLNGHFDQAVLEGGGTDVSAPLERIAQTHPQLSVILTDGYYDTSSIEPKDQILWVISKNGNVNHPMKHIGKTVKMT